MAVTEVTTARAAIPWAGRIIGAGLLAAMAGIHLYLWGDGYRDVATIGMLFLLNGIGSGILALAVLLTPNRWLPVVAGLSALFTLGTLLALIISLTVGLFGLQESIRTPYVVTTLAVEAAGVVELTLLAFLDRVITPAFR
jgi:hypothetical protein